MVAVPFIYFSLLLFFILKKKRYFDVSAYLVALYLLSSFFSILIDIKSFRSVDTQNYDIGIIPTVFYISLLTFMIWPFYKFKTEKIFHIRLNKPKIFNGIVYFFFACFLLALIISFKRIIQILSGDLGELRLALTRGEQTGGFDSEGGIIGLFLTVINVFGGFSLIMLLFYFYSISYLKRSKIFNVITFLSSLTIILISILGVDRSQVVYWLICFGFMIVLFWRHLTKKHRKNLVLISVVFLGAIISYFMTLTFSRFKESDSGATGGMIGYAGQSFINFCYFFDEVRFPQFSLQRIFPLYYKLFINNGIIDGAGALNEVISLKTGKSVTVFASFIGDIMVASGKLATILYCLAYGVITRIILKHKNYRSLYFHQILILFCFITIPLLGLFSHFYNSFPRIIALSCFIFYAFYLKIELSKNNR